MKPATTVLLVLSASLLATSSFAQEPSKTTVITTDPAPAPTSDVGVSSTDGITISGTDVLVTRNGRTEKLTKELELQNGLRIQPNGTIFTRDGSKVTLRPLQILTFEGRFLNVPIKESVAPTNTTTTTVTTGTAVDPTIPTIVVEKSAGTKQAAEEAARVEAERRANAAKQDQIKAAESVQK